MHVIMQIQITIRIWYKVEFPNCHMQSAHLSVEMFHLRTCDGC